MKIKTFLKQLFCGHKHGKYSNFHSFRSGCGVLGCINHPKKDEHLDSIICINCYKVLKEWWTICPTQCEFNRLSEYMQSPDAKEVAKKIFEAASEELGKAAVIGAQKKKKANK